MYNAAAGVNDTFVDSNGQTLLKTGVLETDLTVYPDAPSTMSVTESYDNTTNSGMGGYVYRGVEYDAINNKPLYRSGAYSNQNAYRGYLTLDETDDRFELTHVPTVDASKLTSSAPFTDGTTNYVARAYNNGTYSASSGPRHKTSYDNPSGTNDLDIYISPVTTYSTDLSEAIVFASSGEIQLSGTPDSGYGHWPGNFVKTANNIYATGWKNPSGYGYSSNLNASTNISPRTYRYNGTTGAYIATMDQQQIFANPASPTNSFYTIQATATSPNAAGDPQTMTLRKYNDSTGTPVLDLEATYNVNGYYYSAYIPPIWADNTGAIYFFTEYRANIGYGSAKKMELATGEGTALYTRSLTDGTSSSGTPAQTSEVTGKRLYMVVK